MKKGEFIQIYKLSLLFRPKNKPIGKDVYGNSYYDKSLRYVEKKNSDLLCTTVPQENSGRISNFFKFMNIEDLCDQNNPKIWMITG